MRKTKFAVALALALCMLLSLSACGGLELGDLDLDQGEDDITLLVQGNIDEVYLGKFDPEYLELVGSDEETAEEIYLEGLEYEAEYFAYYWGIVDPDYDEYYEDLDESLRNEIVELYREIYSHSKYVVQDAVAQDDGSYTVRVMVDPIDIMEQAVELYENDEYGPLNDFWAKYEDTDFGAMTDEEYWDYTNEYGEVIVQMVRDLLPNLGYTEQKSLAIQVQEIDGALQMNEDDWGIFDSYVIYYP